VYDVIVIGAGLNGLVAGAMLARRKLSTLILRAASDRGLAPP
jgi:phytoene dehydrogenase-like protein